MSLGCSAFDNSLVSWPLCTRLDVLSSRLWATRRALASIDPTDHATVQSQSPDPYNTTRTHDAYDSDVMVS